MRGRIMEKMCKTCKYCQGDSQCYGQKNAPRVNANDCCERWRARMTNAERITKQVEHDEEFVILEDIQSGTVTIEVSLDWWNSEYEESEEEND